MQGATHMWLNRNTTADQQKKLKIPIVYDFFFDALRDFFAYVQAIYNMITKVLVCNAF